MTGQRFGRLVAIERAGSTPAGKARWLCQCDCGNTNVVVAGDLRAGKTTSCGCYCLEQRTKLCYKHGLTERSEYWIWYGIRDRCTNPNNNAFHHYGGRGIALCERWQSVEAFVEDIGPRPSPAHEIDRIDNDKGYSPDNCRWATRQEQVSNTRRTVWVDYEGKRVKLMDLAAREGKDRQRVWNHYRAGWTVFASLFAFGDEGECLLVPYSLSGQQIWQASPASDRAGDIAWKDNRPFYDSVRIGEHSDRHLWVTCSSLSSGEQFHVTRNTLGAIPGAVVSSTWRFTQAHRCYRLSPGADLVICHGKE